MSKFLNDEKAQLDSMSDSEAVAYWNILQFPSIGGDEKTSRHISLMSQILNRRGIPHQVGRRTVAA